MPDWKSIAQNDPRVQKWWSAMPESKNTSIIDFMLRQKQQRIYDYQKALESGIVPAYQPEHGEYRWDDMGKGVNNPNLQNQDSPNYNRNLLDSIFMLESSEGRNKRAYRTNSVGALGGYQLTPAAFAEIQKLKPQWKGQRFDVVARNDALAREAASDYLFVLTKQLENKGIPLNNANLLAAYHSGAGNVRKGLGPYGRKYVSDARALAGVQPWENW